MSTDISPPAWLLLPCVGWIAVAERGERRRDEMRSTTADDTAVMAEATFGGSVDNFDAAPARRRRRHHSCVVTSSELLQRYQDLPWLAFPPGLEQSACLGEANGDDEPGLGEANGEDEPGLGEANGEDARERDALRGSNASVSRPSAVRTGMTAYAARFSTRPFGGKPAL